MLCVCVIQVYETPAEIAMEEDVIRRTTTPAYRAPEMWDLMSRQRIDTKVDIWVRTHIHPASPLCQGARGNGNLPVGKR